MSNQGPSSISWYRFQSSVKFRKDSFRMERRQNNSSTKARKVNSNMCISLRSPPARSQHCYERPPHTPLNHHDTSNTHPVRRYPALGRARKTFRGFYQESVIENGGHQIYGSSLSRLCFSSRIEAVPRSRFEEPIRRICIVFERKKSEKAGTVKSFERILATSCDIWCVDTNRSSERELLNKMVSRKP